MEEEEGGGGRERESPTFWHLSGSSWARHFYSHSGDSDGVKRQDTIERAVTDERIHSSSKASES